MGDKWKSPSKRERFKEGDIIYVTEEKEFEFLFGFLHPSSNFGPYEVLKVKEVNKDCIPDVVHTQHLHINLENRKGKVTEQVISGVFFQKAQRKEKGE